MENSYFKGKHGPLLIAEIGGNHEGNFDYAKQLTDLAISTGVDYIKFQIYTGDTLVSKMENPARNQHFKKFELTPEQHIQLAKQVTEAGIGYTASVWSTDIMEWIDEYMRIYKVGSGDLTAYPMLKAIAQKQKPIILSTGLSTEQEVVEAVKYIQQQNPIYNKPDHLAVLQCTSMYPIKPADANLNVMHRYKELTGLTIGYSDHTEGSKALAYAVAMGAEVLEFHFTDNREGKQFRDHKVSLTPKEVTDLQNEIKLINNLKGSTEKKPLPIEIENGHDLSFRRAVYPATHIPKGSVITANHLTTLRPKHGIDARDFDKLIGKKTKIDLQAHQKLDWEYFE